ncbi:MAG: cadmium-translocating P-type ATPase [Spirochaetae bacterium HGW-Spirochaetae-5]|nr:MAG: cadmium-translocating P-type ATPase [Spirochaetae bacterium HGW-Spirochaetae-5]
MKKYILKNLDCANCAAKLENSIKKLDCVKSVSIDFGSLSMLIDTGDIDKVQKEIERIEPCVIIVDPIIKSAETEEEEEFNPKRELTFLGLTSVIYIAGLVFQTQMEKTPYHFAEYLLFIFIYLASGWKVLFNAFRNISKGMVFDENFLMTIATLGAIAIHALTEAAGVMLFYKAGEFLQELSVHRSRKSIKALLEIRPDYANLKINGEIKKVSPEDVSIGMHVIVKPGEKIPLDGIVISGYSQIDTSALTGESVPRIVREKDTVLAGTINKEGMITIEVTKLFGESSITRILELVENATHNKAKTELFFTTFAKYYTPVIVAIASLTAVLPPLFMADQNFTTWIYRALVILVISCPCALVVSIPLTYFGGIGGASKRGILIKGSNYLDALNSVKTLLLDKTGTITKGVFKVTGVITKNGYTADEIIKFAAEAEAYSNHPIAVSIRESYGKSIDLSTVHDYQEISGQGIKAIIDNKTVIAGNDRMLHSFNIEHELCSIPGTVVHVAIDNKYAGYLVISDEIKDDSIKAIAQLKKLGIKKIVMLTGDNKDIAAAISREAGIDEFYAGLMPEDKVSILEDFIRKEKPGDKTAFVGDGINDAPILARSDVGFSMGGLGSDAAIETADIVIMNDSLAKIPEAIQIARKNRVILLENVVFALGVKSIFVVLGFIGIATMWEAVFADMGVALIAIFNATRMLKTAK